MTILTDNNNFIANVLYALICRLFTTCPGSKTYFSHLDISARSQHLRTHGEKIILAIAEGAKDISRLSETMADLQTLHAYQLRVDPTNFKVCLSSVGLIARNNCRPQ